MLSVQGEADEAAAESRKAEEKAKKYMMDAAKLAEELRGEQETAQVIIKNTSVPEIIDPVFAKTSQNARFLLSENERFELVFVKTGSINSGTGIFQ
jgi:hypothetical protein